MRLEAKGLARVFNRVWIFRDVEFTVGEGETLLITGRNGSGKSTLSKIIAGVLSPSAGSVMIDGRPPATHAGTAGGVGFVAPYLHLYEEFTGAEHLDLALRIMGSEASPERRDSILDFVGLGARKHHLIRTYSSGMKQRAKYALALIHKPSLLLLDEPMTNLDEDGTAMVRAIMDSQIRSGILVVATNDRTDCTDATHTVDLNTRVNAAR